MKIELGRWMAAIGRAAVVAGVSHAALAAPVIVTPGNLQGWILADGASGTSPAAITGAQQYEGNGSIQLNINAANPQPLAYHGFSSPIRFGNLVGSGASFGFSYLLPVGSPPATSPTIRLMLSGLSNSSQPTRTDGSLGWYLNGSGDGAWHTSSLSMTNGDFFFRIGGRGQAEDSDCRPSTIGGSFDDRRQTLAQWANLCTGTASNTIDLDDALVTGIEVDWGTFSTTGPVTAFVDRINYSVGANVGDYNFELRDATVPEPGSLALAGLALAGLVAAARQRRKA